MQMLDPIHSDWEDRKLLAGPSYLPAHRSQTLTSAAVKNNWRQSQGEDIVASMMNFTSTDLTRPGLHSYDPPKAFLNSNIASIHQRKLHL